MNTVTGIVCHGSGCRAGVVALSRAIRQMAMMSSASVCTACPSSQSSAISGLAPIAVAASRRIELRSVIPSAVSVFDPSSAGGTNPAASTIALTWLN